jgi:hypothetical protein
MTAPVRMTLHRGDTRLKNIHRKIIRRDGSAEDPPAVEPGSIPPDMLEDLKAGWQRLLESEYESAVVSGWMTSALARMVVPLDVLAAFAHTTEDEVRHVDICADVLEALGATPTVPRDVVPPLVAWTDDKGAEEEVLAGLLNFFVVGELISAAEFRHALRAARLPVAVWAISEILRDEAFHGPFGFETARLLVPGLSPEARARLTKRVEDELLRMERRLGGPMREAPRDLTPREQKLLEMGLPPPPVMLGIFYNVVGSQLVPRLEELGLPLTVQVGQTPTPSPP